MHVVPMSTLPNAVAPDTQAYLKDAAPRLAALCTACGACYQACPVPDLLGPEARKADARAVTDGLRRLALGQEGPAETVAWVGACAKSGRCIEACPERAKGLDAMLLIRIARQQAINTTRQLTPKADPTAFPRVKTFARLQLTDEELAQWL